jgi:hypothetical protein
MSELAYIGPGKTLAIHTNVSTLPEPTDYTGGESLDPLKTGRTVPETGENIKTLPATASIHIHTVGPGDVTMTGPVELLAGNDAFGKWDMAAQLAGGASFVVKAQKGYTGRVIFGGNWDRVRLAATAVSGAVTVTLVTERAQP